MSFKYGAEALALLGLAYGLIKWVGRSLRSLASDTPREQNRLEALAASVAPAAGGDMLVRQGLVSAEQLEKMTPRERAFLLATASRQLGTTSRAAGSAPAPPRPAGSMTTPVQTRAVGSPPSPPSPRLHLITPSRPPLGMAVHCPGCGAPLDREALQRYGTTSCGRCKRPVSAHLQKGRLTLIIEETAEEAEYRRRIEDR
ncbi:MAG TPA: hypothetical protein VFZ21_01795 [Gemmatimonadaceae bacterium]|nr:hypothetical protein [Gemmatimonadaceae bacterium]